MAFSKNNKYNANAYNVFIAKPGDKDGKGEAVTLLELERVEADKDKGIVALKVTNAPIDNMYLLMTDDNRIVISPGRPVYDRGNFYVRKPEEQAAGNLDYVSFESTAWPARKTTSYFVRHQGMNVKLTEATDAARKDKVYRQDASWVFEPIK